MFGISSLVYDLQGSRLFENPAPNSVLNNQRGERRVSRTATLDGGAVLYDTGYAIGDKTINVTQKNASAEDIAWAEYIVSTYNTVIVCTQSGAFIGAPEEYHVDTDGVLHISILVTEEA